MEYNKKYYFFGRPISFFFRVEVDRKEAKNCGME
jgi:hypothetical protein